MTYNPLAWEVRLAKDMITDLEEMIETYEAAPPTWHAEDLGEPCAICRALGFLGPMLEDLRGVCLRLEKAAVQGDPPFLTAPTLH